MNISQDVKTKIKLREEEASSFECLSTEGQTSVFVDIWCGFQKPCTTVFVQKTPGGTAEELL